MPEGSVVVVAIGPLRGSLKLGADIPAPYQDGWLFSAGTVRVLDTRR